MNKGIVIIKVILIVIIKIDVNSHGIVYRTDIYKHKHKHCKYVCLSVYIVQYFETYHNNSSDKQLACSTGFSGSSSAFNDCIVIVCALRIICFRNSLYEFQLCIYNSCTCDNLYFTLRDLSDTLHEIFGMSQHSELWCLFGACVCVCFLFFGSPASLTPSSDIHGHALVVNIII